MTDAPPALFAMRSVLDGLASPENLVDTMADCAVHFGVGWTSCPQCGVAMWFTIKRTKPTAKPQAIVLKCIQPPCGRFRAELRVG